MSERLRLLKTRGIVVPQECACCLQPETRRVSFSYRPLWLGSAYRFSFGVPYCAVCMEHVKATNCPSAFVFFATVFQLAVLFVLLAVNPSPLVGFLVLAFTISLPILFWRFSMRSERREYARTLMKPTCYTEGHAVVFQAGPTLVLENKRFAEHLRSLNRDGQLV